ncbi:MAG: DNA alkylation repair protein [Akkermansiaceae bacterium]
MSSHLTLKQLLAQLKAPSIKMGELKKLAKEIKKDHELAMELWRCGDFYPRMLAVLIMDKKLLDQEAIDQLAEDLLANESDERVQIIDWLLANQLTKDKKTVELLESWEKAPSPVLRRLFWYHQARLRWTGKTPPENTEQLLDSLEKDMAGAEPEVQWTMNFTAGWIGIHEPKYRARCIKLGKKLGLYKDEPVSRGCTPAYLPEFIRIEAEKLKG